MRSPLVILAVVLALSACDGPASVLDAHPQASTSKALDLTQKAPVECLDIWIPGAHLTGDYETCRSEGSSGRTATIDCRGGSDLISYNYRLWVRGAGLIKRGSAADYEHAYARCVSPRGANAAG